MFCLKQVTHDFSKYQSWYVGSSKYEVTELDGALGQAMCNADIYIYIYISCEKSTADPIRLGYAI